MVARWKVAKHSHRISKNTTMVKIAGLARQKAVEKVKTEKAKSP